MNHITFKLQVRDNMYRLRKIKGPMNIPPFPSLVNRDTGVTLGLNDQMRQYVEMRDIEKTMMMNPPGRVGHDSKRHDRRAGTHGNRERL